MSTLGPLHAREHPGPPGAPPLLLVHGLTDDGGCWPRALDAWAWAPRHAVDLRGHGRSPRFDPADLDDPMARVADDVRLALVDLASRTGRAPIGIGHSMGAGALVLAARAGAPLAALVLEDPRIAHPTTRVRERLGRMRAREVALWHEDPGAARAAREAACPGWHPAEICAAAAARPLGDPAFLAVGRSGLHGTDEDQPGLVAEAAGRVPTLLLTGDRQAVWTPALLAALAGTSVEVAVVPGADHCVRRTRPRGYHDVVDGFLARVAAGG